VDHISDADTATSICIASWLGVGYQTLPDHLQFGLRTISATQANELAKTYPKKIRALILGQIGSSQVHMSIRVGLVEQSIVKLMITLLYLKTPDWRHRASEARTFNIAGDLARHRSNCRRSEKLVCLHSRVASGTLSAGAAFVLKKGCE